MDKEKLIEYASMAASAALDAANLFTKAITAANSGDQVAADAYLAQARGHWDQSVADWNAAGAPVSVDPTT